MRETEEEIGIRIPQKDLELVHVAYRVRHDATADRANYFFRAKQWEGEPENKEPDKCSEMVWVVLDAIPDDVVVHIKAVLEHIRKGVRYSEYGPEWFKERGIYDPPA